MNIITVNVGQGALAIIRHHGEAIIVDCQIPASGNDTVAHVKRMLPVALKDHHVKGLILTGFDSDHTEIIGMSLILKKYRPDWVMYPTYYKDSAEAKRVFAFIRSEQEARRLTSCPLVTHSVRVDTVANRRLSGLSDNFDFELFSPNLSAPHSNTYRSTNNKFSRTKYSTAFVNGRAILFRPPVHPSCSALTN